VNFVRKFQKISFPGHDPSKVSIFIVSGNTLLFLFLALHELDLPGVPWRPILEGIPLCSLSFLACLVIYGSCYLLKKRQTDRMEKELGDQKETLEKTSALLEEVSAFYQSSSQLNAGKDGSLLSDFITRESLKSLRAQRAILFLGGAGNGQPKIASIFASEGSYETVSLDAEKESACRILKQKKALLLREPRDFSELLPNGGKNRSVLSLLGVPLIRPGKTLGVITVSLLDGKRRFNEIELEWLSLFSHHAAAAIERSDERIKADPQRDSERGLERIAAQLRGLSREEQGKTLMLFQELLPKQKNEKGEGISKGLLKEPENSLSNTGSQNRNTPRAERREEEKIVDIMPGETPFEFSEEFGDDGLFIRTPNPLELGEYFLLHLHNEKGGEPIKVSCKVIWTNQYGKESKNLSRGMGVKFMDLRKEDRKRLEDYLQASPPIAAASA